MAFNLDHTASGNLNLAGSYAAFTGVFTFPKPSRNDVSAVFLTENATNINAITGLQSCLNTLVNTGDVGTASTLNADNTANNALLIDNNNLIEVSALPDAVNSKIFVVANSGQLTLLNDAQKGSVAFTSNNYKTYILTGTFNNINNWIGLLNPDICIDSVNSKTGVALISGNDLSSAVGYGENINFAIECISSQYVNKSCLSSEYKTDSNFANDLSNYITLTGLTDTLNSYPTTGDVSGCLNNYTNILHYNSDD